MQEKEIYDYLVELEKQYAVIFEPQVKKELISLCRDRQSGGLGNFIEVIELLFSDIRPEWETISYQIIKATGRLLHTHEEAAQAFTSLKPEKEPKLDTDEHEAFDKSADFTVIPEDEEKNTKPEYDAPYIDVSTLHPATIDIATYKDALCHKMSM